MFKPQYTIAILKCFFYIFNVFGAIIGLATTAFAVSLIVSLGSDGMVFGVLGTLLGLIMFVTALFGNFAALRNCPLFMSIFTVLVLTLFIVQLSMLISFDMQADIRAIQMKLNRLWLESSESFAKATAKLKCCGFYSYRDYVDANTPIPNSCFEDNHLSDLDFVYQKSCFNEFLGVAAAVLQSFFVILLVLTIFEAILIGMAAILVLYFRKQVPHTVKG